MGHRPYNGKSRKEIRDQVISREIHLKKHNLPINYVDVNLIDFLNKLLKRKSDIRLGANGIDEIKNHSYFNGVVWEDYEQMKVESPFKFYKEDNFDKDYANKEDEAVYNLNKETFTNNFNESGLFNDFYYDINAIDNDDDYEYPYMNQNNKVNNNQNKINENKTLSNADKHTKISSMNGVPTDIYGVNDNNNNNNEKGKESKINDNNKTINSNNEEGKYKYSKSRVERVIRNSVVDMTELNKHNFDDDKENNNNHNNNENENENENKENVVKED
jgi:hypothetical protein